MPIGSSRFLTADVDSRYGSDGHRRDLARITTPSAIVSARLELIRRRVLAGYYLTPTIADELASRLVKDPPASDES